MSGSRLVLSVVAALSLAAGVFAAIQLNWRSRASGDAATRPLMSASEGAPQEEPGGAGGGPPGVYPDPSLAHSELASALSRAARERKHVIVDFGANWCADCEVLNIYFHNPVNWPLLRKSYILVDVNVGEYDANLDLAARYGIPLNKGVPALAVLGSNGRILYRQNNGEFAPMRNMNPASVTAFLERWKP